MRALSIPTINTVFDRWKVISDVIKHPKGNRVRCKCACLLAIEREIPIYSLVAGTSRSCGCIQRETLQKIRTTHGASCDRKKTKLYEVWRGMRQRCSNPNHKSYANYGGKGVSVCAEWQEDFSEFQAWALSNDYEPGLEIDRKNSNGNYEPQNCRIITKQENIQNKEGGHYETAFGETKRLSHWYTDTRCLVSKKTISRRLADGWSFELAISTPDRRKKPTQESAGL